MEKLILIKESELNKIIKEAVNDAVDGVAKKIASHMASKFYNNALFEHKPRRTSVWSCGSDVDDGGCGGGGSSWRDSGGGCGSSSSSSRGGC